MAQVQVRLLGSFQVATAEGPRRLPGHGERALLAALALSVGRPVTLTTLIDSLWQPDDLPSDPVNALQVRVSKLRRALAAIGVNGVVDRQGFAYRLQLEPSCVDVHAFRELIDAARRTGVIRCRRSTCTTEAWRCGPASPWWTSAARPGPASKRRNWTSCG